MGFAFSSIAEIRDIGIVPTFDVFLDQNKIGIIIQFHGRFEKSYDRSDLLDYICDVCEWKLIGRPSTDMIPLAKSLIEDELHYLVKIGALRCRDDGVRSFHYKADKWMDRKDYSTFDITTIHSIGRTRCDRPDERVELFEGAEDFEDVA